MAASPATARHAGLDWLRVAATLGVLTLHAGIAYMPHPLPGLRWATFDDRTPAADVLCWTLDAWVMPVFFLLGGLAAAGLLAHLGPEAMARHRLRRLGGPLLLGCVLILPFDLYVWLLGTVIDDGLPLRKMRSLKLAGYDEGLWGPSHLWFLQYLLLYCLVAAGLRAWRRPKHSADSPTVQMSASPTLRRRLFELLGLAALSAAALAWKPRILVGFDHQPLPQPANLVFFACFFVAGVRNSRPLLSRTGGLLLVAGGFACLLATWPSLLESLETGRGGVAAFGFTATCWFLGWGSLEVARSIERPLPRPFAQVAAAAFWIYLAHHPTVGLCQIALKSAAWPAAAKFACTVLVGLAVPLLTYHTFVRGRWIGRVLGERPAGRATPRQTVATKQAA